MAERTYTLEQNRQESQTMILPTAYWGPCSYMEQMLQDNVRIEVCESIEKQTLRNRCRMTDLQGRGILLTVPVEKVESKQLTRDIRISYRSRWQHQHWMALRSAYEHTPYFLYYADLIRPFYEREILWLVDLNDQLTQLAAAIMQRRIEADGTIHNALHITHTTDWQGQTWTDSHPWQQQTSILDRLMREGA